MATQITDQQRELLANAAIAKARMVGAIIALPFGAVAVWLDGYIIERARNGESLEGFGKGYAAAVALTVIGVALLAGGPPVARFFRTLLARDKNWKSMVLGVLVVTPGLVAYYWLQARIDALAAVSR